MFDTPRPLFARNGYVKGGFTVVMISRIILPLSLDGESVGMLLLGHTFTSPTAEEKAPGLDGVIDGDEYEFLGGPPMLSLVPPPRLAATR